MTITSPDGHPLTTIGISSSNGGAPALTCPGIAPYASPLTCTIGTISQTTTLTVTAEDSSGASGQKTQAYTLETAAPVIAITAPTKSDNADIADTTVEITDDHAVDAAAVAITATNTTHAIFNKQLDKAFRILGQYIYRPSNLHQIVIPLHYIPII